MNDADTAHLGDGDELAVLRLARAEGRLALTRNRALAARRGLHALLIKSEVLEEQLRQVLAEVGPAPNASLARCPVCNQALVQAAPELVVERLPEYVQRTHVRFSWCAPCDRLYWPGSHYERMQALVTELKRPPGSNAR